MSRLFLLTLALVALMDFCDAQEKQKRGLSLFNVVKFDNRQCDSSNGKLGTCYTEEECENKGGVSSGSCAEGYGVCCVFTMNCGGSKAENLTYFESKGQMSGACNAKICKCANDICQLRLDFVSFVIAGPSTATDEAQSIYGGSTVESGEEVADNTRCLDDTFHVTGTATRGGAPVLCGTNTGYHIFVDASSSCNTMAFTFGDTANSVSRQWDIRVTQYTCDSMNAAPQGCLQYFYGSTSGYLETFNWANKMHLSDQNQLMCIRQEEGFCRICYSHDTNDFGISNYDDSDDEGYTGSDDICCASSYAGDYPQGFDCIIVRNPTTKDGSTFGGNGHLCGSNLVTDDESTDVKTICTRTTPFQVRFLSNTGDHEDEFSRRGNTGFKLHYEQFSC